jgi:predicted  nucleic acid-binding Zn-ribbon protein
MSDEKKSISMNELKSVQPRSLKSRLLSLGFTIVIGVGGFYGGIYYGIMKTDVYMENLMTEYEKISDDVDAFVKVSDPKTIRAYVKELNKILDDVKFLNKIIETGQMADESLNTFFEESQSQLDEVNERIVVLALDTQGMLSKLSEDVTSDLRSNKVELENTLKSESDSVRKEIGKLYDKTDELYKELEQVSILLDKAKETFMGKQIFK